MSERKIEAFWRDATVEDIERFINGGEKLESRFWRIPECPHEVYDPPQWYLDKPDPGEGYRLLGKFPAEELQPGDEWFESDPLGKGWKVSHNERQANFLWYRRRIEPVKIESRYRDNIPKGWVRLSDDELRLASDAYWSQGASEWCLIGDDRIEYANRDKWPAIRQRDDLLIEGKAYALPKGLTLEVYKNGFEVY